MPTIATTYDYVSVKKSALIAACLLGLLLTACEKNTGTAAPPPPQVTVATPIKKQVSDYLHFTGNLAGVDAVEIRARVKGFIQAINATPGSAVKKGDVLFTIDPAPYQAILNARKGSLVAAQARAKNSQITYVRMNTAFKRGAIARADLDKSIAERDIDAANVKEMQAAVNTAKLDLDYTLVAAPIDGRIGLNQVDKGALVGADGPTLLTTLLRDNRLRVRFNASENQLAPLSAALAKQAEKSGRTKREEALEIPVQLALGDSGNFTRSGKLFSGSNTISTNTGTFRIEARFDNADYSLIPGAFVRLRLVLGNRLGILVPEVAVNRDQVGTYLLLVDANNKVLRRDVVLGVKQNADLIRIDKGLTGDERVIVNGLQRARIGAVVAPSTQPARPPTAPVKS